MKKIAVVLLIIANSLIADTIIFRNGDILHGKVVTQKARTITVRTKDGKRRTIPKHQIVKVVFKDLDKIAAEKIRRQEEKKERERLAAEKARKEKEKAEQIAREAEQRQEAIESAREKQQKKEQEKTLARQQLHVYIYSGLDKLESPLAAGIIKLDDIKNILPSGDQGQIKLNKNAGSPQYNAQSRGLGFYGNKNRYLWGGWINSSDGSPNPMNKAESEETNSPTNPSGNGYGNGGFRYIPAKQTNLEVGGYGGYDFYRSEKLDSGFVLGLSSYSMTMDVDGFGFLDKYYTATATAQTKYTLEITRDMYLKSKGLVAGFRAEYRWSKLTLESMLLFFSHKGNYSATTLTQQEEGLNPPFQGALKITTKPVVTGGEFRLKAKYPVYKSFSLFAQIHASRLIVKMKDYSVSNWNSNPNPNSSPTQEVVMTTLYAKLIESLGGKINSKNSGIRLGVEKSFDL